MMRNMKRLGLAFLIPVATAAGAAPGDRVAPPVVRKPSTTTSAPKAPNTVATPRTDNCPTGATPCAPPTPPATEETYFSALTASAGTGGDLILDKSLMRAMSRLMAANRCPDAIALATKNGRAALVTRAKQLCKVG